MMDSISRQEAIDIVSVYAKQLNDYIGTPNDSEVYAFARGLILSIERNIRVAPSVQPEIVRCKDCRWGRKVCGNVECFADTNVPAEYHGYEWFCPNGERRS